MQRISTASIVCLFALSSSVSAQIVIDDFQSAPLTPGDAQPTGDEIRISQNDLMGVAATTRRVYAGDIIFGCCPEGEAISFSVATENGGTLKFDTDFRTESLGLEWVVAEFDATDPTTSVIQLAFDEFVAGTPFLPEPPGTLRVSMRDVEDNTYGSVGVIDFDLLSGGGTFGIPLNRIAAPPEFDMTRVRTISLSTGDVDPGMSFSLASVRLVPEPSAFVATILAIIGTVLLLRRSG